MSQLARLVVAMSTVALLGALAPATSAASPGKADPQPKDPRPLYCGHLPKGLPDTSFMCIDEQLIEMTGPSGGSGGVSPAMDPGVLDKWTWSRNLIWRAFIGPVGGPYTQVASVRETEKVTLNGRRSDSMLTLQSFTGGPIKPRMLNQCQKDNGWFPTSECSRNEVIGTVFLTSVWKDSSTFYHAEDDQYWYKFTWSMNIRDHPSTNPGGVWYTPSPGLPRLGSLHLRQGYPFTERCRFS